VAHELPSQVTKLLQGWRAGERTASDALLPLVYDELRRLAHHHLRNERPHHTLQSTALVNKAYLRLVGQNLPKWESRAHFLQSQRNSCVRSWWTTLAAIEPPNVAAASVCSHWDDAVVLPQRKNVDVVALDDALNALAEIDPRQNRVVELRFFAAFRWRKPPR
jgi:RNA polymerase sigma factor (TIGR02999 family)